MTWLMRFPGEVGRTFPINYENKPDTKTKLQYAFVYTVALLFTLGMLALALCSLLRPETIADIIAELLYHFLSPPFGLQFYV